MKNLLICISILLFIAGLNSPLTAQPQYYNYNTTGTSNSFPWNIAGGKEVQLLYLPGDFIQPTPAPAGNITSIAFMINQVLGPWTYTDLTIKMGQSSITSFASGSFYAPLTTVYYRASVSLSGASGQWMTITLDTPFAYDPTQSLIVDVGQCGAPGATGFSAAYTAIAGANRRLWSVAGCPFVYSNFNTAVYHFGITLVTSGPPIVVTTAATAVTTSTATLNGTVNANGDATTVSFEYGLSTTYGTTVPGVPPNVTGTTVNPVSADITGLLPGNTYHYRVIGTNANGTTNGNDMTFSTPPVLPVVVTTAASGVASTTATLNGTVDAGGDPTAVTFEYGLNTTYGTTVPGVPGTVTGNTVTAVSAYISGLILNTTYHYRIKGVNSVGTTDGNDMMFTTTSCPAPGAAGVISGPVNLCGNSPGNVYTVAPISNATGYTWSVPSGAVITAGANTNSITVTIGNTPGIVSVYGTNTCGNGAASNLAVTVNAAPVPVITGYTTLCVNIGPVDYLTEPGMANYVWTVSPGNTITGGQGTNQIQVSWTVQGAQWVAVNYTSANGCAAAVPTQLNVTVQPVPGPAGAITGTAAVCAGTNGVAYNVGAIPNAATYVWSLPSGATIASGDGTNSIMVDFDPAASSGELTVYGNTTCGNGASSPPFTVTVTPLPDTAGMITGQSVICQGTNGIIYSVPMIGNASGYNWNLPAGATIDAGANTNSITVSFDMTAVSGTITVNGTNSCGNGAVGPEFGVTVNPVPPAPVITVMDDINLHSDAPAGNQWYFGGALIPGATGQDYTAEQSGEYWCIVILNGCSSGQSNHIVVTMTGTDPLQSGGFTLYPIPNDGQFTVSMTSSSQETFSIQVFNIFGVMISEVNGIEVKGTVEKVIDLRPVANGIYNIVIRSSSERIVKKIVVNR